jgi:hypothetical protein
MLDRRKRGVLRAEKAEERESGHVAESSSERRVLVTVVC